MLHNLSTKVVYCLKKANNAQDKAKLAKTEESRQEWLEVAATWETLAASIILNDRITAFIRENELHRKVQEVGDA